MEKFLQDSFPENCIENSKSVVVKSLYECTKIEWKEKSVHYVGNIRLLLRHFFDNWITKEDNR